MLHPCPTFILQTVRLIFLLCAYSSALAFLLAAALSAANFLLYELALTLADDADLLATENALERLLSALEAETEPTEIADLAELEIEAENDEAERDSE